MSQELLLPIPLRSPESEHAGLFGSQSGVQMRRGRRQTTRIPWGKTTRKIRAINPAINALYYWLVKYVCQICIHDTNYTLVYWTTTQVSSTNEETNKMETKRINHRAFVLTLLWFLLWNVKTMHFSDSLYRNIHLRLFYFTFQLTIIDDLQNVFVILLSGSFNNSNYDIDFQRWVWWSDGFTVELD